MADNRRVLRMTCKGLLLMALPLAGFVWALPDSSLNLVVAACLTVLSLAAGFGAEYLASSTEQELQDLDARITEEAERRTIALEERDERLRQFDRMVTLLTSQNHDLRAKLVSLQVQLQRKKEALLQAGETVMLEDRVVLNPAFSARAH